jgi:hypothetical protein
LSESEEEKTTENNTKDDAFRIFYSESHRWQQQQTNDFKQLAVREK